MDINSYSPSDEELKEELNKLPPGTGIQKMVRIIKESHPTWASSVDSRRVRTLRKPFEDESPITPSVSTPSSSKSISKTANAKSAKKPSSANRPPPRSFDSDSDEPDIEDLASKIKGLSDLGVPPALAISMFMSGELNMTGPQVKEDGPSPMEVLMSLLTRLCAGGDSKAAKRVAQIDLSLKNSNVFTRSRLPTNSSFTKTDYTFAASNYPMKSCKLAATIILEFGAPDSALPRCISWCSRSLGGLPTAMDVVNKPTADLFDEYMRVKVLANGDGHTTILGVNLVDVEMMLRGEGIKPGGVNYQSFSHTFVMIVAPDGVRILQAWGEWGYSLGENIASNAGRLRSSKEAEEFVLDYDRLCSMKGPWNIFINELYAKLFGVDIFDLSKPGGPMKLPIVPQFSAWTRVLCLQNVKKVDIVRWEKIVDNINKKYRI